MTKVYEYPKDKSASWLKHCDLQPMFQAEGYIVDPETYNVRPMVRQISWDTQWDYVNADPKRCCNYLQMLAKHKKFVPSFCENCWKVVVKPRTLRELYQLRNLQREMVARDKNCWCKCGIEERFWVPGLYGGYFYTDSFEQGAERYAQVRTNVDRVISPDVPVILKRYCTEFEIELGDSAAYKRPEFADKVEEVFYSMIGNPPKNRRQPMRYKQHVYFKWQCFGWKWGTPEDRREIEQDWNNGDSYYPIPRTYHHNIKIEHKKEG